MTHFTHITNPYNKLHGMSFFSQTRRCYLCHPMRCSLHVLKSKRLSHPMTYQHLTLRMFESTKRNEGMVDQKIFKTAKRYGFDSVYFDECSMDMIEKNIKYIRPLLTPTCKYVLVNPNGKQFQKLTELFSALVFEAIGKYILGTTNQVQTNHRNSKL